MTNGERVAVYNSDNASTTPVFTCPNGSADRDNATATGAGGGDGDCKECKQKFWMPFLISLVINVLFVCGVIGGGAAWAETRGGAGASGGGITTRSGEGAITLADEFD